MIVNIKKDTLLQLVKESRDKYDRAFEKYLAILNKKFE
tara:strand:- start:986 stop:1099 length:114 start_codon:yes stop_codon:yes gene_type:complete